MRRLLVLLGLLCLVTTGCARLVTAAHLRGRHQAHAGEPVNRLYYMGTRKGLNHVCHVFEGGRRYYVLHSFELQVADPFPLTRDERGWRLLPVPPSPGSR